MQYSLVNIVWGTASTGDYGGTVFPGGVRYSLVNNVCGVRYSLGYRIHSDTGCPISRKNRHPNANIHVNGIRVPIFTVNMGIPL